ncbi:MAG: acyltransferase [Anaerolineae bacterium]
MSDTQPEGILLFPGVHLGPGVVLEPYVTVGKPPRGRVPGELETRIGEGSLIRSYTTLYAGTQAGKRLQTGQCVSIREDNVLGNDCSVGTGTALEPGNRIGHRVRIHSNCFLEWVTLEDDVFVGPGVIFTDDLHPPCPRFRECRRGATVRRGARLGAGAVILPGVTIGAEALVGAGAVVTRDVPDGMVVVGNPARPLKRVEELTCPPGFYERPYVWLGDDP